MEFDNSCIIIHMDTEFDPFLFIQKIKNHSYYSDAVDWKNFESKVYAHQNFDLKIINELLRLVDKHSFAEINHSDAYETTALPEIESKLIDGVKHMRYAR
jgi:hypothetical protein